MKRDPDIKSSPVLNPILGFGGEGVYDPAAFQIGDSTGGGCLKDGIFKDFKNHISLGANTTIGGERCIKRNIYQFVAPEWLTQKAEDETLAHNTFEDFAVALEGNVHLDSFIREQGIHNAGHFVIGGDVHLSHCSLR